MDKATLEQLLAYDFSQGEELFRDELLSRLLAVQDARDLKEESLGFLAAAGELSVQPAADSAS